MLARTLLLMAAATAVAAAEPAIDAPATAPMGGQVEVTVTGSANPRDFVTIVPKGSQVGRYAAYQYTSQGTRLKLQVPTSPGEYEVRLLGAASPYPTLASRPIRVEEVKASVDGPAQVDAGAKFQFTWTGPNNERDYVGIGDADPKGRAYITYAYTRTGSPATLVAPDKPGEYELRYYLGSDNRVIASKRITVGSVDASVSVPATIQAGGRVKVTWTGPNNDRDFITIVKAGTPDRQYGPYEYTRRGSPLELRVPDQAGEYEVRYLTGQSYATLGSAKITITPTTGSLQAPKEAVAGSTFEVAWKGPDNSHDYITLVEPGAREGASGNYAYTARGNPAKILAPLKPGDYELRYSTGQSHATLARTAIRITPAQAEPGHIAVKAAKAGAAPAGAIEIVLDASGSMLQRIGSQRRIDIAKQTLTELTAKTIPAGTPFALRVFGREVDSCQTDLDIPLAPLAPAAVAARIGQLEAKNNARTPIGASLEKVAEDLRAAGPDRLVILLTDGEETCGGAPAAAIEQLRKGGATVRINIVGFAIDDPRLAATFRHWAELGGGRYFDSQDAAGLRDALSQATRAGFEVLTAQGQAIAEGTVDGEPVSVLPGSYTVRLKGASGRSQPVTVKPQETAAIEF